MSYRSVRVLVGRRINGAKLATARLAAGLTQKQLGELIGRHPDSIARLEAGNANTSPATLAAICEALNITERKITEKVPEPG